MASASGVDRAWPESSAGMVAERSCNFARSLLDVSGKGKPPSLSFEIPLRWILWGCEVTEGLALLSIMARRNHLSSGFCLERYNEGFAFECVFVQDKTAVRVFRHVVLTWVMSSITRPAVLRKDAIIITVCIKGHMN